MIEIRQHTLHHCPELTFLALLEDEAVGCLSNHRDELAQDSLSHAWQSLELKNQRYIYVILQNFKLITKTVIYEPQ